MSPVGRATADQEAATTAKRTSARWPDRPQPWPCALVGAAVSRPPVDRRWSGRSGRAARWRPDRPVTRMVRYMHIPKRTCTRRSHRRSSATSRDRLTVCIRANSSDEAMATNCSACPASRSIFTTRPRREPRARRHRRNLPSGPAIPVGAGRGRRWRRRRWPGRSTSSPVPQAAPKISRNDPDREQQEGDRADGDRSAIPRRCWRRCKNRPRRSARRRAARRPTRRPGRHQVDDDQQQRFHVAGRFQKPAASAETVLMARTLPGPDRPPVGLRAVEPGGSDDSGQRPEMRIPERTL